MTGAAAVAAPGRFVAGLAGLLALCLSACATAKPPQASASAASASVPADSASAAADSLVVATALEDLERAVLRHDTAGVVDLMDPDYISHELGKYFQGVSGDFLNNLFCGNLVGTDQFYCAAFGGISSLRRESLGEGAATVTYRVKAREGDIRTRLQLVRRKQEIGFIGSRGYTQVE